MAGASIGYSQVESEYQGKISYLSAQSIYVRFDDSNNLHVGDTLYVKRTDSFKPIIVIESRSSLSCMGTPLSSLEVSMGEDVYANPPVVEAEQPAVGGEVDMVKDSTKIGSTIQEQSETGEEEMKLEERIRGRISASSYSRFSNETDNSSHRLRYNFSLQANNIGDSRFSTDTYLAFTHKTDDWTSVQENIFSALKIYSLAVKYQPGKQSSIWLGRRVNRNLSNIGAIDGLQYETGLNDFRFGAVVGFRPDYQDYSLNTKLLEFGAYVAHDLKSDNGLMSNSLAFFEQQNKGNTDRRFMYFQHSNSLLKNLFLFVSSELDLYTLENGISTNTLSLTSLYFSLRYRIICPLSVYVSYDARKNVIYYETFKNLVDRLLEEATRQGLSFRVNYRPINLLSIGLNTSYRVRDNDIRATKTLNGFVSMSRIPGLDASATLSANLLQTSYLDGQIFGARFYKDLLNDKLYTSLGYRYVNYQYFDSSSELKQHIGELDLTWRIARKFSLSANYEMTIQDASKYNNIYLNLTKRF
jgi:hypothetical protein